MEKPQSHWFEFVCMNCAKHILSIQGTKYLGGWIPHLECGYETVFRASTHTGPSEQIAVRLLNRANHNQDSRTTPQSVQ
jgi:hypothetical protein